MALKKVISADDGVAPIRDGDVLASSGYGGKSRRNEAAAFVVLLLLIGAIPASAQPVAGDSKAARPPSEQGIISHMPRQLVRLHALRRRILGKVKFKRLPQTKSEVWTVPKARMVRLKYGLRLMGVKVTHLRDDWNHILKREKKPMLVSRSQEDVLANAKRSPATVNIGLMRTPEPAVAEYALTGSGEAPGAADSTAPDDGMSRLIIPISDNQQITVVRTKARHTEQGVTWRGTVEETGESAVLMWWKDGRLSGVLGYKGHIYAVMNMGDQVHAVIEVDPKKMPPDHANRSDNPGQGDRAQAGGDRNKPLPLPKVEPISPGDLEVLNAKKIVIDVMMLYTKKAASHYMLQPGDAIELAIEQANESFRNSGLGNINLRLVHTQAIDYDEKGAEQFTHLYRMVDGDGVFKDLRRLATRRTPTLLA